MICVHRLNGSEYFLNSDLILYLETIPDTVITLNNGTKLVVAETTEEVCSAIVQYQKLIRAGFSEVKEKARVS
jgi:flagellar protein FlbD